jgi:cytochrome c oxidase assembly factor CtaG
MNGFANHAATMLLLYGVVPVWIAAGLADYFCHRATAIEQTSGTLESALHLVQFSLVGIPVTLALFLQPNAGFFLLAIACIVLYHAIAAIDLVYANPLRRIAPREQMVHSFLEITPITALLLLGVIYWPQLIALFGQGPEAARFGMEIRILPPAYIATVLASAFLFNMVPYVEELARCIRAVALK